MHNSEIGILIFYVSYMFWTQGFIFGRQLYMQLWYGTFYMHQYNQSSR